MVRIVALFMGLAAMGVVSVVAFNNNVELINIVFRGIFSFFAFYFLGTIVGVVIVKNTIEVFEKRHKIEMELLKTRRMEQILKKKQEIVDKQKEMETKDSKKA